MLNKSIESTPSNRERCSFEEIGLQANEQEKFKRSFLDWSKEGNSLFAARGRATITTSRYGLFSRLFRARIQYVPGVEELESNKITYPLCPFLFACESHAASSARLVSLPPTSRSKVPPSEASTRVAAVSCNPCRRFGSAKLVKRPRWTRNTGHKSSAFDISEHGCLTRPEIRSSPRCPVSYIDIDWPICLCRYTRANTRACKPLEGDVAPRTYAFAR